MKPIFIVLDGLDGSGKSTQIEKISDYISSKNKNCRILTTREPSNSKYGRKVREILRKEKDPMLNAKLCLDLYIKDREEHLKKVVEPFLEEKDHILICDRYFYSTIAFQHTQGIPFKELIEANKGFRKPDIAFILDIKPSIALERIKKARPLEKFEQLLFMKKLRKNFLVLPELLDDKIKIVDASQSAENTFRQIKREIDKLMR